MLDHRALGTVSNSRSSFDLCHDNTTPASRLLDNLKGKGLNTKSYIISIDSKFISKNIILQIHC